MFGDKEEGSTFNAVAIPKDETMPGTNDSISTREYGIDSKDTVKETKGVQRELIDLSKIIDSTEALAKKLLKNTEVIRVTGRDNADQDPEAEEIEISPVAMEIKSSRKRVEYIRYLIEQMLETIDL